MNDMTQTFEFDTYGPVMPLSGEVTVAFDSFSPEEDNNFNVYLRVSESRGEDAAAVMSLDTAREIHAHLSAMLAAVDAR